MRGRSDKRYGTRSMSRPGAKNATREEAPLVPRPPGPLRGPLCRRARLGSKERPPSNSSRELPARGSETSDVVTSKRAARPEESSAHGHSRGAVDVAPTSEFWTHRSLSRWAPRGEVCVPSGLLERRAELDGNG
ncbi:unnamed protein product [Lampetra planeri]